MDSDGPLLGLQDVDDAKENVFGTQIPKRTGCLKRKRDDELTPEELAARENKRYQREARMRIHLQERSKPRLIIGIDFGTTYSGVSYVSTVDTLKEVHVVTNWSGGGRQNDILEKVPTRISYGYENGHGKDLWGYIKPGVKAYGWFKLLLDNHSQQIDDPLLRKAAGEHLLSLPLGKSAQEVATDFLRFLYDHTMGNLTLAMGQATLAETPIIFHFSVPAIWSPDAKSVTKRAAVAAGFMHRTEDEVYMIDEPEAAAISSLRATKEYLKGSKIVPFKVGTCTTVLDIGGGTADAVTYKIVSWEPLKLQEACVGEGAKCGGTSVDRALHALLQQRYGTVFTDLPSTKIGIGSKFMEEFETIKRDYTGEDPEEEHDLRLKLKGLDPDDKGVKLGYDFDSDEIKISGHDIESFYQQVFVGSEALLLDQIKRVKKIKNCGPVKHIVIVGGVGSSPYVLKHFQNFCQEHLAGEVTVLRPPRPWSAICRGACLRGLESAPILHRRSRYHYGIKCHKAFEQGLHSEQDAFHTAEGRRVKNQMEWHIAKGECLNPNAKRVLKCYYDVHNPSKKKPVSFLETIYYSDKSEAPVNVYDKSVMKLVEVCVSLTATVKKIQEQREKEQTRRERTSKKDRTRKNDTKREDAKAIQQDHKIRIGVNIEMTLGSDQGLIQIVVKTGRVMLGSEEAQYLSMPVSGGDN